MQPIILHNLPRFIKRLDAVIEPPKTLTHYTMKRFLLCLPLFASPLCAAQITQKDNPPPVTASITTTSPIAATNASEQMRSITKSGCEKHVPQRGWKEEIEVYLARRRCHWPQGDPRWHWYNRLMIPLAIHDEIKGIIRGRADKAFQALKERNFQIEEEKNEGQLTDQEQDALRHQALDIAFSKPPLTGQQIYERTHQ